LGDTKDWNVNSEQRYNEWPLDTRVDPPIFRWFGDTLLPLLFIESAEYAEPDKDEALNEVLLHEPESLKSTFPRAPPTPQKAVLFYPLAGQLLHLKWWLTQCLVDNLNIFYMFAEMGNDERTEIQLKFQDSSNSSVFVPTPKVCGTGLNLTAGNHAVITQKFWALNEQRQAVAQVVWLGQNQVPHS
jgi:SNF2 family DNA or RNA helicase